MSEKISAEKIAEMADKGMDVTPYLSNPQKGYADKLAAKKIRRTTIDFGAEMINDLDKMSSKLNISRQAVIKMALQEFLIRYYTSEAHKERELNNLPF